LLINHHTGFPVCTVGKQISYHQSVKGGGKWESMYQVLDNLTLTGDFDGAGLLKKINVFEVHAGNNPSFIDLVDDGSLARWKRNAHLSNTTFFVFSFWREPISWALSAFFMICVRQNGCRADKQHANATSLDDLQRLAQPNPQCGFVHRGGLPYNHDPELRLHPNSSQCERVWEEYRTYMDWVGTVEDYDTTMHLLERIFGFSVPTNSANVETHETRLRWKDIANTTTETQLANRSQLDLQLYRRVQNHYTIDRWETFGNRTAATNDSSATGPKR
jgi:hypothetical protein